jgi:hypothetical protein
VIWTFSGFWWEKLTHEFCQYSHNYYSNKMHTFIIKSTRYHNLCFMSYILPLHVSTRVGRLQGAQCQCLAKVIINYNLLKLC